MQIKLNKLQVTASVGDELNVSVKTGGKVGVNIYLGYSTVANSYNTLSDKPKINDIELVGNKTLAQLGIEPKRGVDDFYVTGAEKNQGALATGVANPSPISGKDLSTVKKLASEFDKTNRVLVDFTVPSDVRSIDFTTTNNGELFNTLNLRSVAVVSEGRLIDDTVSNMFIGINGLYSETDDSKYYLGVGNQASGFGIIVRQVFSIISYLYVNGQNCNTLTSNWRATSKNPLTNVAAAVQTGNKFNNVGGKITSIRVICSTPIKAGTNFKIYRND